VEPGAALGGRTAAGTTQVGCGEVVQDLVRAHAADVGDALGLERIEEVGRGEPGVGPEPDVGDERTQDLAEPGSVPVRGQRAREPG